MPFWAHPDRGLQLRLQLDTSSCNFKACYIIWCELNVLSYDCWSLLFQIALPHWLKQPPGLLHLTVCRSKAWSGEPLQNNNWCEACVFIWLLIIFILINGVNIYQFTLMSKHCGGATLAIVSMNLCFLLVFSFSDFNLSEGWF